MIASFVWISSAKLAPPANAQSASGSPLRDFVGQWMLSREICDALRSGRIDGTGDEPIASIANDGIVFGSGTSANICRLQSARMAQGRLEGRFACIDEQNQAVAITLTLAMQGRRLEIRQSAPKKGAVETWWFCAPLDPDHSVGTGVQASASPEPRPSKTNVEQRALLALADELREAEEFSGQRPRTRLTAIDLNGDGQPDALVTIYSSHYGALGCSTEILEVLESGVRHVGSVISCEISATGQRSRGWLDLKGGGSKIWRYDGSSYR